MDTEKNKNKAGIIQVGQFGIDTTLIQEDQGRAVEQWNRFTGVINRSQYSDKELSTAQLIKDSEQVLKLIEQLVPNIQTLVQEYKESHKEFREARDAQLN